MDAWTIVGIVGGSIGALACILLAVSSFSDGANGRGVAYLALTPVAFFVVYGLAILIIGIALVAFLAYIAAVAIGIKY
jgi:hypothetical protein